MTKPKRSPPISMPTEMNQFVDMLLPEIEKSGIQTRNELVSVCYETFLERLHNLQNNPVTPVTGARRVNIIISNKLAVQVDSATHFPAIKAMWLPEKTSILSQILGHLLAQYVPKYKDISSMVKMNVDDLKMTRDKHLK